MRKLTKKEITKSIISELNHILKTEGFKKDGSSWWVLKKDVFAIKLNLQASQWGNQYYLNYGFQIDDQLKNYNWKLHFSERIGVIYDFEKDKDAMSKIIEHVTKIFIPKMKNITNMETLKEYIKSEPRYTLTKATKDLFGIKY